MIRRILVPLDGSPLAERALPHAAALARAFGAQVVLLQVLAAEKRAGRWPVDPAEWRLRRREAVVYLGVLATRLKEAGLKVRGEVAEGNVEETIVGEAIAKKADLIVVSTHGRGGFSEFGLGGTAAKVLVSAGVSVLVVRSASDMAETADLAFGYDRVLVAVDCSPRSDWALHLAARIARSCGAELLVAHVVPMPELVGRAPVSPRETRMVEKVVQVNREAAQAYLDDVALKLAAPGLEVRTSVQVASRVAVTLDELAQREDAGLVVLSAHGASGPSPWPYGSVSGMLATFGSTPLLIFQDVVRTSPEESAPAPGAAALAGNGWSR
jgi:nucleotide-binding universal stress UspA family protein